MVQYTEEKRFTQEQVQQLFLSVGWVSGQYPQRLYKALMHSSTVHSPIRSSYTVLSIFPFSNPSPLVVFPCGSKSTVSTLCPASARQADKLIAVVVFPTPPF